jgi:hypothetical protein
MKLGKHPKHWPMFATKKLRFFWIFLDFTVRVENIWAQTEMGTSQHFFYECKSHAHIGDVFLNILISYSHFSELVWIWYDFFKVTVKRSKGKSIRRAKWFGQERVFLETRGKPVECYPTRGIKPIKPYIKNTGMKIYRRGSTLGPWVTRARPRPQAHPGGSWGPRGSADPNLCTINSVFWRKNRRKFHRISWDRAAATSCYSSGGLIWSPFGASERGIHHRSHQQPSFIANLMMLTAGSE